MLLCLAMSFLAKSQEPSSFKIGEKELANSHVYSIIKSDDNLLYIATNLGIKTYINGAFKQIDTHEEQIGSALFGLRKNSIGDIYCFNLSGQIFKVNQNGLELITVVPKEHFFRNFDMQFDNQDHLIFISKSILLYQSGQWKTLKQLHSNSVFVSSTLLPDRKILIPHPDQPKNYIIENGELDSLDESLKKSFSKDELYRSSFQMDQKTFSINAEGRVNIDAISDIPLLLGKPHLLDSNSIWILDQVKGVRILSSSNGKFSASPHYFTSEFISCAYKDSYDTYFLGTFNHGLIIIPDFNSKKITENTIPERITGICSDNKYAYMISRDGRIYKSNLHSTQLIHHELNQKQDRILYIPNEDFKIVKEVPGLLLISKNLYGNLSFIGTIKNAIRNELGTVFATSKGIFCKGNPPHPEHWKKLSLKGDWYKLLENETRCQNVFLDNHSKTFLMVIDHQLYKFDKNGLLKLLLKKKPVTATSFSTTKNGVAIGTQKLGVLVFNGKDLKENEVLNSSLNSLHIRKVLVKGQTYFILHKNGFEIYNRKKQTWKSIGTSRGLASSNIQNFTLVDQHLWFISDGRPIIIDLNTIEEESKPYSFHVNRAEISGLKLQSKSSFSYDKNDLRLEFDFRGILYQDESRLMIRIEKDGEKSDWEYLPITIGKYEKLDLSPGSYKVQLIIKHKEQTIIEETFEFEISKPFWNKAWFLILMTISVSIIAIVAYRLYLRSHLRRIELEKSVSESRLKAIQSQMNPHFIFNALNSIQDQVLTGEKISSYSFISKFADLVRKTLNYSEKDLITLEQEIKLIELYLSLEKLRFKDKISFEISYDSIEGVLIPPMIVQPFIENALAHGLLHKKEKGNLIIDFKQEKDKFLIVRIKDDGVGREKAKVIKERQSGNHESFSTQAIEKRLKILSDVYSEDFSYEYIDLQESGASSGTEVYIKLPLLKTY